MRHVLNNYRPSQALCEERRSADWDCIDADDLILAALRRQAANVHQEFTPEPLYCWHCITRLLTLLGQLPKVMP